MTEQPAPPPEQPKAKRKKPPSRAARWAGAVGTAQQALAEITGHLDALEQALNDLVEVQQEYSDWKDNLPENLASSPLGEKLETVCDLQLEGAADAIRSAVDEIDNALGEAEGAELPMGFGRD